MVLRTFETDEEKWKKFKAHCIKEGIDLGEKLNSLIDTELKEHGDGNPAFKITDFNDPNFIATPALTRSPEDIRKYLEKIWGTPEWDKIGRCLDETWVKQYNDVEASHL